MERPFSVLLTDLDGVVFWRIPAQKAGIPLFGHSDHINYDLPKTVVSSVNGEVDKSFNPLYIFHALRHLIAPAFPDVISLFSELQNIYGVSIYGHTGRHNNTPLTLATILSLEFAGISKNMNGLNFRQKGRTTLESKTSSLLWTTQNIASPEEIVVADDNPMDLLPMAKLFREARFVLIKDLTTNRLLRGVNLEEDFPNVTLASTLRKGLLG